MALGFAGGARAAGAEGVTDADRLYRNYIREAATVASGQIRLEVRGMTMQDEGGTRLNLLGFPVPEAVHSETGGIFDVLGSYGLGNTGEIGFLVPTFFQSQRVKTSGGGLETQTDQDVGDVQLYGKFKQAVGKHCAVAGGVELAAPTGVEHKGFGTGELGVNPFVSTRYQNGSFGVGTHVGYQMHTGCVDDVLNYSVEAFVRPNETYALRAELSGRYFQARGERFNDVVVMPGIDYNLTPNITIRPTGLANVTDEALDWGIGLGLAYTF